MRASRFVPCLLVPFAILMAGQRASAAAPEVGPAAKIVLVAGSNVYKPGEHEYVAGCRVLADLLRQTSGVTPVVVVDWPDDPTAFADARAVVLFLDGGDKHALLDPGRREQVRAMAEGGVGLVQLHQVPDYPIELGDFARGLMGAAWEKGYSKRAHWVSTFETFPDHPIFRGVEPFRVDDGWLTRLRFVPEGKGVTPLLRTAPPDAAAAPSPETEPIVAWAFERPDGGRSFSFTGGHLHRSLAEAGYRRFLVNGILWGARVEVPASGAPVAMPPDAIVEPLDARVD